MFICTYLGMCVREGAIQTYLAQHISNVATMKKNSVQKMQVIRLSFGEVTLALRVG